MIDYHDERPVDESSRPLARSRSLYAYGVGALLLLAVVAGGLIWYTGTLDQDLPPTKPTARAASTPSTAGSTPIPAAVPASPTVAAPPRGTAAPATAVAVVVMKVANTGGQGANLRSEPGTTAAVVAPLSEGSVVEVVGPDVQVAGKPWKNVKDRASGKAGWMSAEYLAPNAP